MYISDPKFPWPRHFGLKNKKLVTLSEDFFVGNHKVPAGTEITTIKSKNFGFVILPKEYSPRIFKY